MLFLPTKMRHGFRPFQRQYTCKQEERLRTQYSRILYLEILPNTAQPRDSGCGLLGAPPISAWRLRPSTDLVRINDEPVSHDSARTDLPPTVSRPYSVAKCGASIFQLCHA
ncbi:hypothetical protein RRG08_048386 [Elysia crispata]|uniref:Uncharacterized protein n=1 Tax=Elysia crispata TaxID=231223 RepID=A0AAE1B9A6_9GAST|nr:hypothetical protein RRG08_048386 [Elysia crispata]